MSGIGLVLVRLLNLEALASDAERDTCPVSTMSTLVLLVARLSPAVVTSPASRLADAIINVASAPDPSTTGASAVRAAASVADTATAAAIAG
jgi:hypothetical protein